MLLAVFFEWVSQTQRKRLILHFFTNRKTNRPAVWYEWPLHEHLYTKLTVADSTDMIILPLKALITLQRLHSHVCDTRGYSIDRARIVDVLEPWGSVVKLPSPSEFGRSASPQTDRPSRWFGGMYSRCERVRVARGV